MNSIKNKRQVDFQVIAEWIHHGEKILDLGCGRGVLLEFLKQRNNIYGIGVDLDFDKILSCLKRGVNAYQGDIKSFLNKFDPNSFDRVILSRTIDQLEDPQDIIIKSLEVGKRVTIGFVNNGYWKNRLSSLVYGSRLINEVNPNPWYKSLPSNNFSIREFELFCEDKDISIKKRICFAGDWKTRQKINCNFFAGYAIYDLALKR